MNEVTALFVKFVNTNKNSIYCYSSLFERHKTSQVNKVKFMQSEVILNSLALILKSFQDVLFKSQLFESKFEEIDIFRFV